MRLFFIPGFGEDPSIFDKIHPHLPGEKVFIDNWKIIGEKARRELTVLKYAEELIGQFGITRDDVVIGHSMGGWIALHIKHLLHCPIVQIASWTEERKVVKPVSNWRVVSWSVKRGLYFNSFVKWVLVRLRYRNRPSAEIFSFVFDKLCCSNREAVINQLRIIYKPVHEKVLESPDLRIHAKGDTIIRFPDEECCEVPGDHFTLFTHPEQVYEPIAAFLQHVKEEVRDTKRENA